MVFRLQGEGGSVGFGPPPAGVPASGTTSTDSLNQYLSQVQSSVPSAGQAPAESAVPFIYLGSKTTRNPDVDSTPRGFGDEIQATTKDRIKDYNQMVQEFEDMDKESQRKLALYLAIGGYMGSVDLEDAAKVARGAALNEVLEGYMNLLDQAANAYAAGQKMTPDQLLARAVAFRLPGKADWDGKFGTLDDVLKKSGVDTEVDEEEDLSGTHTSTSRSVDFMDPADAKALTRSMLQRELGRDPTKAEFEDFIGAVHAAEAGNPTVTRNSVTTDSDGRVVSSNSTTHQGIGVDGIQDRLLERARSQPDWAEWQAVGTYAPALFEALGATIPGR